MNKNKITVNGKVKFLPQHLLQKKKQFQTKKKKKNRTKKHVKAATMALQVDPELMAQHGDDYISSDTSAEWFDGDEDSDSKAYGPGGYLRVRIGDKLHNRYVIESKLGWGHFSTVWLATDLLRSLTLSLCLHSLSLSLCPSTLTMALSISLHPLPALCAVLDALIHSDFCALNTFGAVHCGR